MFRNISNYRIERRVIPGDSGRFLANEKSMLVRVSRSGIQPVKPMTTTQQSYAKEYAKEYRLNNKEKIKKDQKKYWEKNKEELKLKHKEWYKKYFKDPEGKKRINKSKQKYVLKNKEKILAFRKKYRAENKEEINRKIREWYYKNKDKVRARQRIYERVYKNTVHFKIKDNMRKRIMHALKKDGGKKTKRTMKLVGCTVGQLKQYIEKQFQPGMSWEQRSLWHIDHIIPCASFDLTKLSEQKKCFHYTNLQPLWAIDNMKKGAKLDYEKENTY